jgi:aminoglycoside 3-N-acetyltransferase
MPSYSDLKLGLTKLGLTDRKVIAHASVKAFGEIDGGAETLLKILLASVRGAVMPAFTYKTMVTPAVGPPNNAITYGGDQDLNKMAEPFHADMPVDPTMGILPELLRRHPWAKRSFHPIQSFAGINADEVIDAQTLYNPLALIGKLAEQDGWILLLGVDHTVNTSIHYAERLAGRKQFTRWALTMDRVVECPGFPGDSSGFNEISPEIEKFIRRVTIGEAVVQAMPLRSLIEAVIALIKENPLALLCQRADCGRCQEIRNSMRDVTSPLP